jgi:NADPH:quinone reductase-like Zn-dependent oxidoreductase
MSDDEPVAPKPSSLGHPEAASLSFGGITALGFMRDKGGIKSGDKLLVVGASGAVGSAAVQLARESWRHRHRSCSSTISELVHSIGAARVIDYRTGDFAIERHVPIKPPGIEPDAPSCATWLAVHLWPAQYRSSCN